MSFVGGDRVTLSSAEPEKVEICLVREGGCTPQAQVHEAPTTPVASTCHLCAKGYPLPTMMTREPRDTSRNVSGRSYLSTKGWSVPHLLDIGRKGKNFREVERVKASLPVAELRAKILENEKNGLPLIVEGWHEHRGWDKENMTMQYFIANAAEDIEVRDCKTKRDMKVSLEHFLLVTRESVNRDTDAREILYGKDALCPELWKEWLESPSCPLPDIVRPGGPEDLLYELNQQERVETLMCYLGASGSSTAAHKDLCASSGQNLMVATENDGSSFWFMTESNSALAAAEFFRESVGVELDHEQVLLSPKEFARAPFTVYIAEQKLGDLVYVPRRSCHQVVNRGGLTLKMSWSRMTVDGLTTAFFHELPLYRRVCRTETYRIKLIVLRVLMSSYSRLLTLSAEMNVDEVDDSRKLLSHSSSPISSCSDTQTEGSDDDDNAPPPPPQPPKVVRSQPIDLDPLLTKMLKLLILFERIINEEWTSHTNIEVKHPDFSLEMDFEGVTCDFCGADIFQSFFECKDGRCRSRESGEEDNITLCPGCYVEGRSCACGIMSPMQRLPLPLFISFQTSVACKASSYLKSKMWKPVPWSPKVMKTLEHPALFESACYLHMLQQSTSTVQTLKCSRTSCGVLPRLSAMSCRKCHNSKCFKHLLENGMHVAEIYELVQADSTQERWHEKHQERRRGYTSKMEDAKEAVEKGIAWSTNIGLSMLALHHSICSPMKRRLKRGVYDNIKPDNSVSVGQRAVEFDSDDEPLDSSTRNLYNTSKRVTKPAGRLSIVIPGARASKRETYSEGNLRDQDDSETYQGTPKKKSKSSFIPDAFSEHAPPVNEQLAAREQPERRKKASKNYAPSDYEEGGDNSDEDWNEDHDPKQRKRKRSRGRRIGRSSSHPRSRVAAGSSEYVQHKDEDMSPSCSSRPSQSSNTYGVKRQSGSHAGNLQTTVSFSGDNNAKSVTAILAQKMEALQKDMDALVKMNVEEKKWNQPLEEKWKEMYMKQAEEMQALRNECIGLKEDMEFFADRFNNLTKEIQTLKERVVSILPQVFTPSTPTAFNTQQSHGHAPDRHKAVPTQLAQFEQRSNQIITGPAEDTRYSNRDTQQESRGSKLYPYPRRSRTGYTGRGHTRVSKSSSEFANVEQNYQPAHNERRNSRPPDRAQRDERHSENPDRSRNDNRDINGVDSREEPPQVQSLPPGGRVMQNFERYSDHPGENAPKSPQETRSPVGEIMFASQ